MYGIPRNKRKITPKIAVQSLAEQGIIISLEEAEMVLEIMYDFAKLALNQLLRIHAEGQDQPIHHPGPG